MLWGGQPNLRVFTKELFLIPWHIIQKTPSRSEFLTTSRTHTHTHITHGWTCPPFRSVMWVCIAHVNVVIKSWAAGWGEKVRVESFSPFSVNGVKNKERDRWILGNRRQEEQKNQRKTQQRSGWEPPPHNNLSQVENYLVSIPLTLVWNLKFKKALRALKANWIAELNA